MSRGILSEVIRFVDITGDVGPKCVKSKLWRRQRDKVLRMALTAHLATAYQDEQDTGACEGSWENEICEQETHFGTDLSGTRTELLKKRLRDTSKSSTEKTNDDNVVRLKV